MSKYLYLYPLIILAVSLFVSVTNPNDIMKVLAVFLMYQYERLYLKHLRHFQNFSFVFKHTVRYERTNVFVLQIWRSFEIILCPDVAICRGLKRN